MTYTDPLVHLLGDWAGGLNVFAVILRLFLAFAFSTGLGWERSRKLHSAGLRTFNLTAIASVGAMLLDVFFSRASGELIPILSAAVLIGVSIIGSNTILYSSRNQVKGLTTAVALWANCILGLALGSGFYVVAIATFIVLLLCLAALPPLESFLKEHSTHFEIHLELKSRESLADFIATIRKLDLQIIDIEANPAYIGSGLSVYSISILVTKAELQTYAKHDEIIEALRTLEYVSFIEEVR